MNRALDAYALRQETIARNIANATTPNYRPEKVRFEEEFAKVQGVVAKGSRTDGRHIRIGALTENEVQGERRDADVPKPEILFSGKSHVNVDTEMADLAQNQIRFRFASRMLSRYFLGLQNSIRGTNQ